MNNAMDALPKFLKTALDLFSIDWLLNFWYYLWYYIKQMFSIIGSFYIILLKTLDKITNSFIFNFMNYKFFTQMFHKFF